MTIQQTGRTFSWALAAGALAAFALVAADSSAASERQYASGTFGVEVGGASVGAVKKVAGGMPFADVVLEANAGYPKKHPLAVQYQDVSIAAGAGMARAMYDWIAATLNQPSGPASRDGAVVFADYQGNQQSRLSWYSGFISKIAFPACDASSRDAAFMDVDITPARSKYETKSGGSVPPVSGHAQKWLPSNFRLQISGIDAAALSHVAKVEPISVDFHVMRLQDGSVRPTRPEISNVVISVAEPYASQAFYPWLQEFLLQGRSGDNYERSGQLQYLATDGSVLFTLSLGHLGIIGMEPAPDEAGSQAIRRTKITMYVESVSFSYTNAAL